MAPRIVLLASVAIAGHGCASGEKLAHLKRPSTTQTAQLDKETRSSLSNPVRVDLNYAGYQAHLGNYDEARAAYGRVLADDQDSVAGLLGLARLDELAGRTAEAERHFTRAAEIAPEDPRALAAVGNFYANTGRNDRAAELYQQSLALDPTDKNVSYGLGLSLARLDRPDAALPHLTASVGAAAAHYNIGYLAFEKGQIARAEKAFLQASVLDPDLADAVVMLDEVRRLGEAGDLIAKRPPAGTGSAAAVRQVSATSEAAPPTPQPGHPLLGRGYRSELSPQQLEQLRNQTR